MSKQMKEHLDTVIFEHATLVHDGKQILVHRAQGTQMPWTLPGDMRFDCDSVSVQDAGNGEAKCFKNHIHGLLILKP